MERLEMRAGGIDVGRGLGGIGGARSSGVRGSMPARIAVGALAVLLSFGAVAGEDTFERAVSLATEKRYAEAREVLDAVLEREPDHVEGRLLHGVLHARVGRLGDAIETFEALRREYPEMAESYNNLAVLYAMEGRLEEARETLLAILERHPDPVAYANLGDVYSKLARRAYDRAKELEAGDGRVGAGEMGATASAFCARAGGFEGRRAVAEAALWLRSQGAEVLEVRREERQVSGPWRVYLPPFASREEAEAKLRETRSRGVRDVAVIRDGELANGISFGVYRDAANARRRAAALDRLGYAVRSHATEAAPADGYELRARTRRAAAAFEADWASRFPERPLQVVDCG